MTDEQTGYGKRPLWQWVAIYIVVGAVVYGLIYYFVFAKQGGYNYGTDSSDETTTSQDYLDTAY